MKGEIYQPVSIIPSISVKPIHKLAINNNFINWEIKSFSDKNVFRNYVITSEGAVLGFNNENILSKNQTIIIEDAKIAARDYIAWYDSLGNKRMVDIDTVFLSQVNGNPYKELHQINYDHIPAIVYTQPGILKLEHFDIKTVGHSIGYITGAGDKVPQALEQMGYKVTTIKENDLTPSNLKQFDAIVTGVRAYNTNDWLSNKYEALMQYVKEGGVLLTQYNTNNFLSTIPPQLGPHPFTVSRSRVTDEEAKVNFLLPKHPLLNYPNKITEKDFEGWIQERSIYNAEKIDSNYQRILSMKDPNENEQEGSLIVANYGKGRFIYTGLVFFRELPAGVPGAYRLFANLIANKRKK